MCKFNVREVLVTNGLQILVMANQQPSEFGKQNQVKRMEISHYSLVKLLNIIENLKGISTTVHFVN